MGDPKEYQKFQKIQGNFYFLNTVLEEQFCVGCADTKFHTIFHHWKKSISSIKKILFKIFIMMLRLKGK